MITPRLMVVGGEADGRQFNLKLPCIIGRGYDATLTIQHSLVSRLHCEIFARDGRLFVRDLESMNGTYVNNFRIASEQALLPDQLLTLGNVTFRAVYEIDQVGDCEPVAGTITSSHRDDSTCPGPKPVASADNHRPAIRKVPTIQKPLPAPDHATEEMGPEDMNSFPVRTGPKRKDACDVLDEMLPIAQARPDKSISVSAIKGLGEASDAVSFVGPIQTGRRNPEDVDPATIELVTDKSDAKIRPDDSALGSFVRRLPR